MIERFLIVAALVMPFAPLTPAVAQSPPPTLGVPNTNPIPPSGPPVEVEDCRMQMRGGVLLARTGKLIIDFTNEGNVTADLVRFRVQWGSDGVGYIRDQGSFAPGITIKHEFRQTMGTLISPLFSHPDIRCDIESIHFVDGTVWTRR